MNQFLMSVDVFFVAGLEGALITLEVLYLVMHSLDMSQQITMFNCHITALVAFVPRDS